MSNLEAELARFEAELAAVETTHHQEPHGYHEQPASDAHHYYMQDQSHHMAAPQGLPPPPASHPTSAPPAAHPHTQPMYHQYQAPVPGHPHAPPPPMMPSNMGYPIPQQMYGAPAGQGYYPPPVSSMPQVDAYSLAPTMMGSTLSAAPVLTAPPVELEDEGGKATDQAHKGADVKKSGKSVKRHAAGQTWWDQSLSEWPDNDFRIFVGDLGNEVNDDILGKAFQKYGSFARAKVVRDKRSNKSKGFGFVSFMESSDYAKVLREMDGKYIGNRPCKLRKSTWTERNAFSQKKNKKQKT